MQNSKQKIDLQIYFNIAFLSNFILNEPVCYAKTFCFIKLTILLNQHFSKDFQENR